jgi:trk system potassium uptake protein TrkA
VKQVRVLVVGVGRFGTALVETLWRRRAEVAVVDTDPAAVERIRDRASHAFVGDATDPAVLEGLEAASFDAVVITFGVAFEASVLCTATLRTMGAPRVIVRAETGRQADILRAVGASRVLQIEGEAGERLARELLSPVELDLTALTDAYRVVPWVAEGKLVGRSLADAQLRKTHGLTVVGYRAADRGDAALRIAGPDYVIRAGDTLLLVGEEEAVRTFFAGASS